MKKLSTLLFCLTAICLTSNATNYFVDPSRIAVSGDGSSWDNAFKTITEAESASTPTNIYIKGGQTITSSAGWTLKAANYYGSCDPANTGTSTTRTMYDNDGNGIIEPWEFKYPTVFLSTYSGTGNAFTSVASTTLDGLTITQTASPKSPNAPGCTLINPIGGVIQNCVFSGSTISYPALTSAQPGGCLIRSVGDFKDCLIEKNTISATISADYDVKITPILEFNFNNSTVDSKLSRCVFRNNKANISCTLTGTPTSFKTSYLTGMMVTVTTTTTTQSATISDCLFYNNEVTYTNTASSGGVASLSNASIIGTTNFSNNVSVSTWINNTIANNKLTNCSNAMYVPTSTTQFHKIYNNVFWNNQNNGTPVSMKSGSYQSIGSGQTIIANNIMDCVTSGNLAFITNYFANNNNKINLSTTNTNASTGPQFKTPSTFIGCVKLATSSDSLAIVNHADWRLNPGSYLAGKGIDQSQVTTDKVGNTFANPRAAGAYEGFNAPAITGVTPGNAQLSIAFTAGSNGGSAITNYKYSIDGGANFIACNPAQTTSPITISSGLSNGTSYNVQIRASNATGDGTPTASVAATPTNASATTPAAPTINYISSGNAQLSVTYNVGSDGGSAITGYKYSTDGGANFVDIATANPLLISTQSTSGTPALVNGALYSVQIKAVNTNGDGTPTASVSATTATVPDAPTNVVATAGANITAANAATAQASVSFTAPANNGGSPVLNYVVTASPGGKTAVGTASPIVVGSLNTGTGYTFTVVAGNAVGQGATSSASTSVSTPATNATLGTNALNQVPNPPTMNTATITSGQVSQAFTPPTYGGSTAITDYKYSTDGGNTWTTRTGTASPVVITGLTNGATYNITLKAVNSIGDGLASTANTVTVSNVPNAPIITGIAPSNGSLSVAFTGSSSTGGMTISTYQYSTDGGATFRTRASGTTASPIVISTLSSDGTTPLANGTAYNIQIRNTNNPSTLYSALSNIVSSTPSTTPAAPSITGVTAANGALSVAFTAGSSGGSSITNYKYSTDGGTSFISANTTSSPLNISTLSTDGTTVLTNGTSYNIQIKAINGNGEGTATASTAATPYKPEPTNQPTNLAKGTVTSTAIPLTFTEALVGSQAPDGYLVKMSTGSVADPVDGTDPEDVTTVTSGTANVKVTSSPISSFSGITAGTMYHYKMYSYTNSGALINFNTTSAPTLDIATLPVAVSAVTFAPTVTDFSSSTLTANLSWTNPGSFDSGNHSTLVFVKQNSVITVGLPSNGPGTYTASTNMTTGNTGTAYQGDASAYCVYNGTGTSVSLSGMVTGATYYVLIVTVYNTANSDGTYSYSSGASASAVMYKKEPIYYPTNLAVSNVTSTSISLIWTPSQSASQAPDGYMVISKALSSVPIPVDGTDQTDVAAYTNNSANMKVTPQSATGMSSFSNMTPGTTYFYKIFPYTNSGAQINYKTSGTTSNLNYATFPNPVTSVSFNPLTTGTATISWTLPAGYSSTRHSTLVFLKAVNAISTGALTNSPVAYTANTVFGSGTAFQNDAAAYCVYNGDGTSVSVSGLSASIYQVLVYTVVDYVNYDGSYSYSSSASASGGYIGDTSVSSLAGINSQSNLIVSGGNLVIDQNASVHSLLVTPSGQLTINSGQALTTGSITLQSDATGTATLNDSNTGGGLTVTGLTSVQQYLTSGRNWYISSPLSGANSTVFAATNTNPLYYYDETIALNASSNAWAQIKTSGTALNPTKGYIANMDATVLGNQNNLVTFTGGNLNTGAITTGQNGVPALTYTDNNYKKGFNLVGNPYPSYLDWDNVVKTNVMTSIWLRTKVSSTYLFDTYNASGQLGTSNSGISVNNHIPPMQAFWVRATSAGASLAFSNSLRSHKGSQTTGSGENTITVSDRTFKAPATIAASQSVLRIQVSNGTLSDEAILYSNPNALNSYDEYDSPKMFTNSASVAEIYTLAGKEQLAINGLNSIPYDTEIPLGFTTSTAGNFSLKAYQISNFTAGTQVVLKDYADQNNPVSTDLTDGSSYSFSSGATANNSSRFTLIFHAPAVTTGINPAESSTVWISTNANNEILINANTTGETSVTVYNAVGQKLLSKNLTKTNVQIGSAFAPGVYIVTVNTAGKTQTKKIIID